MQLVESYARLDLLHARRSLSDILSSFSKRMPGVIGCMSVVFHDMFSVRVGYVCPSCLSVNTMGNLCSLCGFI